MVSPNWEDLYDNFASQYGDVQRLVKDPRWFRLITSKDSSIRGEAAGEYHDAIVRGLNIALQGKPITRKIPTVRHSMAVHYRKHLEFAVEDAEKELEPRLRESLLLDIQRFGNIEMRERFEDVSISELRKQRGRLRGGLTTRAKFIKLPPVAM